MQFVYKPEGAEPRRWDFNPAKLMSPEVEAIERHTALAFGEWINQVGRGSFVAIHGLLYVLLKRTHPTLKWDEVQFCMEDIDFEMNAEERAEALAALEEKATHGPLGEADSAALAELRDLAEKDAAADAAPKDED